MPACNLAESIHNKWLQASGNKGGDLYVATVDDYVRAFLQVAGYHDFNGGGRGGSGPSPEELLLRVAQKVQRTGDPSSLTKAVMDYPGAEKLCTRDAHLEGAEEFGSRKRKADVPIGDDDETHRPDTVSYSRPRIGRRVTRAHAGNLSTIQEEDEDEEQPTIPSTFAGPSIQRVTAVQETKVDEGLWHIARLRENSAKACWGIMRNSKNRCESRIVQKGKATAAPTYTGVWQRPQEGPKKTDQFFFCADDIERCVKGTRRKWIMPFSLTQERPPIPSIWPVKIGTNLTRDEMEALENAGFRLPQKEQLPINRTFNNAAPPRDLSHIPVPDKADVYPKSRRSKTMKRIPAMTRKHMKNIESATSMQAKILKVTMIPQPGFGCIVDLESDSEAVYRLSISKFPDCSCPAFKKMISALGRRETYRPCKHLYFITVLVCKFDADADLFIHAATLSFNEVKKILEGGILDHVTD